MKKHIISYATPDYFKNQKKLNKSALAYGVDTTESYNLVKLKKTPFYRENKLILDQKRGAGYWLWKPYIILDYISQLSSDEMLIYSDVGIEIITDISPLIDLCHTQRGILLFRNHGNLNRSWTKRDCFVLMGCDTEMYYNCEQIVASFQVYIKTEMSIDFLKDYLGYCQQANILTDLPNTSQLNNLPEFVDHRHDQSVLSLLAAKYEIEIFRDPSQFGNHMKTVDLREPGEWKSMPYSNATYINSPYPTLLNHHRERPLKPIDQIKHYLRKLKQKGGRLNGI